MLFYTLNKKKGLDFFDYITLCIIVYVKSGDE